LCSIMDADSKELVVRLREQLSELQDKYMALEEAQHDRASSTSLAASSTVATIETLYREKNSELQKEVKRAKRAAKEANVLLEAETKRGTKKIEEHKARTQRAEEEADMLRERVLDLQTEVDKLRASLEARGGPGGGKTDTFDGEGQFQMLYRETLNSLNEERDKRREQAVSAHTELQNAREEKEDAKELAATLRAELDVHKLRAAELERAYQNDLRIEKEKEALLEREVARLKDGHKWQEQVDELRAELERARSAVAGELLAEQALKHEADKQLLIEKQIATMEDNFGLKQRLEDYETMREKLFFAMALSVKLSQSLKGVSCNDLDATAVWHDEAQELHFSHWQALLEQKTRK
jgi:DNA repair exonuclease SbcCD ATPase subunit